MALQLCGELSGAFAWPGESWALPITHSIWRGGPPAVGCRDQLEEHVIASLRQSLIEMQAWAAAEFGSPEAVRATDDDVFELAADVLHGVYSASSIRTALIASCGALQRFLSKFSHGSSVVEKTPGNVHCLPYLADQANIHWVLSHREPFSVIASMQRRDGADPFAVDWAGGVERCLGEYLSYGEAVLASRRFGGVVMASYDETYANPAALQETVVKRIAPDLRRQKFFKKRRVAPDPQSWRAFAALDRWKILNFSAPVRRLLGYSEDYYGAAEPEMAGEVDLPPQFECKRMGGSWPNGLVTDVARFAVYVPRGVVAVRATFQNHASLALFEQMVRVVDCRKNLLFEQHAPSGSAVEVVVDLRDARCVGETESGRAYLLEVSTSRCVMPVARIAGNYDERVLAGSLSLFVPAA